MNYEVTLDNFNGPLDLLLHLIKESKLEIMDIKIEDITKQYLDFINKMERLNLNIASEYLVMASELLEIKSKKLLPRKENVISDEAEEVSEESLIQKLLDYEAYKNMTSSFKTLEEIRQEIYTKTPTNLKEFVEEDANISIDVTLDDLINAFSKFIEREKYRKPLETKITKKEITVDERRAGIRNILREKRKVSFFELFDVLSKEYIVVTFLAILEMCRKSEVTLKQENEYENILIERVQ